MICWLYMLEAFSHRGGMSMFSSLDKRMKILLQVVILLYIIFSSLFVFLTIKSRSLDMQHQLALQYTGQQHQNAQLFMKWMEELARVVTSNGNVQQAVGGGAYDKSITPLLDGMSASNLYILDLALYGREGSMYASSRLSGFKTYDEVRSIPAYSSFLASGLTSQWLIVDTGSLVYRESDPRRRLIYLEKLDTGDGTVPGLLVMDVDLHKMTSFYAFQNPDAYPGAQTVLYTRNRTVVDLGGWTSELPEGVQSLLDRQSLREELHTIEGDDAIFYLRRMYHSDDYVLLMVPGAPILSDLMGLRIILVVGAVAILVLSFLMIRQLSASIFDPLRELYRNMRRHYNK